MIQLHTLNASAGFIYNKIGGQIVFEKKKLNTSILLVPVDYNAKNI